MKRLVYVGLALLLLFTLMFGLAHLLGLTDEALWTGWLESLRARPYGMLWAAVAVVGLLLLDLLLPVPSSVVMVFSGYVLGPWLGTLASFTGLLLAAVIGFWACRLGGQRAFRRFVGDEEQHAMAAWFERWGTAAIILSRPIPMMTEVLSCLAGLSGMAFTTFLLANLLGGLPISLVYALAGAWGERGAPMIAVWTALVIPALGWLVTLWVKRRNTPRPEA